MVSFNILFYPVLASWLISSIACYQFWRKNYIKTAWGFSIFNFLATFYLLTIYAFLGNPTISGALFFLVACVVYGMIFWYLFIKVIDIWDEERYDDLKT